MNYFKKLVRAGWSNQDSADLSDYVREPKPKEITYAKCCGELFKAQDVHGWKCPRCSHALKFVTKRAEAFYSLDARMRRGK